MPASGFGVGLEVQPAGGVAALDGFSLGGGAGLLFAEGAQALEGSGEFGAEEALGQLAAQGSARDLAPDLDHETRPVRHRLQTKDRFQARAANATRGKDPRRV